MINLESNIFTLENFEGPLDLLWHLIQKNEIEIHTVSLQTITEQFLEKLRNGSPSNVDVGAEFISLAASLLVLKTRTLLPTHEEEPAIKDEIDPSFEIIYQLLDYCHFKDAAKELVVREQRQEAFYFRGITHDEPLKNLGIAHLCLEDLAALFQQILAKAASNKGKVHEEVWKVSDKISWIRKSLLSTPRLPFGLLLPPESSREELIVTFLAILELMKTGEIQVIKDLETNDVMVTQPNYQSYGS
jgi:segregation and condensation protein A